MRNWLAFIHVLFSVCRGIMISYISCSTTLDDLLKEFRDICNFDDKQPFTIKWVDEDGKRLINLAIGKYLLMVCSIFCLFQAIRVRYHLKQNSRRPSDCTKSIKIRNWQSMSSQVCPLPPACLVSGRINQFTDEVLVDGGSFIALMVIYFKPKDSIGWAI